MLPDPLLTGGVWARDYGLDGALVLNSAHFCPCISQFQI